MLNLTRDINPTQAYINDWEDLGKGMIAHRYGICSTSLVCYALYVQTETGYMPAPGEYSTITHHDEYGWMGSYTTKGLPPELAALPAYSQERSTAVQAYFKELEQVAEIYIRSAFPQDFLVDDQEVFPEPVDTFPSTEELEAFYQEARPYYEMYHITRVAGKPDKWHIIQNVHHADWSFRSIISYGSFLPIFDTREEAVRALAVVSVVRAFYGLMTREEVAS